MITIAELKKCIEDLPDSQPVMVQIDDENGFSCQRAVKLSKRAIWTGPNNDKREMQLYVHIYVPLSPETAE